eukprot:s3751_g4.t2
MKSVIFSVFSFSVFSLGEAFRHEDKGLGQELFQDPKPRFRPAITFSKGFSVDDTPALAGIIHGCFNEKIKEFQDCIKKESKEKYGYTLYAIVSDAQNSFQMAGLKLMHLHRIALGPVLLDDLPVGLARRLRKEELAELRRLCGLEDSDDLVRIPLDYPDKSRCIITSWGNPVVNWNPNDDKDPIVETPTAIDPMMWMPIADELQQRPSIKKFAACRQETRIASRRADEKRKRGIEVPEMTRILLSSNPSLPRLAAAEQRCVDEGKAGGIFPPSPYFRLVMEKGEEKWGDNWWEVAAPRNGSCESIVSLRHPPALSTMLDEVGEAEVEQFLGHSGVKSAWLPHWSIGHGGFSRAELPPDLRG